MLSYYCWTRRHCRSGGIGALLNGKENLKFMQCLSTTIFVLKEWTVDAQRVSLFSRLVLATFVMGMAGCATVPASLSVIDTSGIEGESHQVLVVTSREATDDPAQQYSDGRADALSYNDVAVWVPENRKLGSITYPSSRPKPEREFAITRFTDIDAPEFSDLLNQRLDKLNAEKTVFVFVHGYNTPYSNGVFRIGQLVADFEADAVPVHYSWPSKGSVLGYLYDRDSVQFARDGFVDLLERVADSDAESIFIMGHSMGTLLVMEGLRTLAALGRKDVLEMISPLILASPDIDVDVFKGQMRFLDPKPDPFIVFVASDDGALKLSEKLRGGHARVGEGQYIPALQEQGIAVIDLSDVELGDGAQHSAFASSPTFIQIVQQARAARETLTDADSAERRSPLEALSQFTSGLLYLPKRVIEPGS